jgi:hypothetical protein
MRSRIACSAVVATALLIGSATAVAAAPADSEHSTDVIDADVTISDTCSFDFDLALHISVTQNFVATANNEHVGFETTFIETDTLTGPNGVPLVSEPYRSTEHTGFKPDTDIVHDFLTGHIATFDLPDGSTFRSTGRVTELGGYMITPTTGHAGDVDALCAALD